MQGRDYTGRKIGRLTLLGYDRPGGPGVGAFWHVRCECGRVTSKIARFVAAGKVVSCGECPKTSRHSSLPKRVGAALPSAIRKGYRALLVRAAASAAEITLTQAEYRAKFEGKCLFCSTVPARHCGTVRSGASLADSNVAGICRACLPFVQRWDLGASVGFIVRVRAYWALSEGKTAENA